MQANEGTSTVVISPVTRLDFVMAMSRDSDLSGAALRVGMALVSLYDHKRGYAYPSHGYLGEMLGIDERTVRKCVAQLTGRGWFVATGSGGRSGARHYFPAWQRAANPALAGRDSDGKPGPPGPGIGSGETENPARQGRDNDQKPGPPVPETRPSCSGNPALPFRKPGPPGPTIPVKNPIKIPVSDPVCARTRERQSVDGAARAAGEGIQGGQRLCREIVASVTAGFGQVQRADPFGAIMQHAKARMSAGEFQRWLEARMADEPWALRREEELASELRRPARQAIA